MKAQIEKIKAVCEHIGGPYRIVLENAIGKIESIEACRVREQEQVGGVWVDGVEISDDLYRLRFRQIDRETCFDSCRCILLVDLYHEGELDDSDEEYHRATMKEMVDREFPGGWGCSHEYDCCGCWSIPRGEIIGWDGFRAVVAVSQSRNV